MEYRTRLVYNHPITACKQYYLAAGATQGNIAYTQNVSTNFKTDNNDRTNNRIDISKIKQEKTLGASHIGGQKMVIFPKESLKLIKKYFPS